MKELTTMQSVESSIEAFQNQINAIGESEPEKAYIIGNQFAKIAKNIQETHKEGFQKYFDANKELPGGYDCRITRGRITPDYSADPEWAQLNEKIKAREEFLKNVVNQSIKGLAVMDDNGVMYDPVPFKMGADIYSIVKK